MKKAFITSLILVALPAAALAETINTSISDKKREELIMRACTSIDEDQMARCRARQEQRINARWGRSTPTTDFEIRDRYNFGRGKLRNVTKNLRNEANEQHWSENRKTYREMYDVDETEPQIEGRASHDDMREARLKCMLQFKGRPLKMCLDRIANQARKAMRPESVYTEREMEKQY